MIEIKLWKINVYIKTLCSPKKNTCGFIVTEFVKTCNELVIGHSTISSIIQRKEKLKEQGIRTADYHATHQGTVKSTLMMETERALLVWIEKQTKNKMPISLKETQFWAKQYFEWLKNDPQSNLKAKL